MNRLLLTVALHSLSPALLFGLSVVIARWWGPAEQGGFVAAKAWLDVLVAMGCFGFPQSVMLAINRDDASRSRLYLDASKYALALPLLMVPVAMWTQSGHAATFIGALAFAIGAMGIVLSNIWRAILLTVTDGLRFNLITIVPAFALTLSVSVVLLNANTALGQSMAFACAASGVLTFVFSVFIFPPSEVRRMTGRPPAYRALATNGADVFVQAAAMALQTFVCYSILSKATGLAEVGRFSIALMAFQACLMPLQMVSPLIFNRWSRRPGHAALDAGREILRRLSFAVIGFIAAVIAVMPWAVPALLGPQFEASVPAAQIALVAVYPAFVGRIAGLRLAAIGGLRPNSLSALVRGVVTIGSLWSTVQLLTDTHIAVAAAVCWLLGEVAAAVVLVVSLRIRLRDRIDEVRVAQ